jgi:transcriptional regulator with XRE-family HTH domain
MNSEQILRKIGERIKELRELKGISQQVLAAKCNFEKANMSRIEAGRTNFTISTLYKISQALDTSLSNLVDVEK